MTFRTIEESIGKKSPEVCEICLRPTKFFITSKDGNRYLICSRVCAEEWRLRNKEIIE